MGIIAAAILIAVLSVRDWATRAPTSHPLAALSRLWPGHPAVAVEDQLIAAALAAKSNRSLGPEQRSALRAIVASAPLQPQPFMLEGAVAQLEGNTPRALQLYQAARLRDPRDGAARLLLADLELRNGRIASGLSNLIAITRVEPKTSGPVLGALVEYAQVPGAAAEIRRVLEKHPALAQALLEQLAADASNRSLIQALAPADGGEGSPPWKERLVDSTIAAGRPAEARRLWLSYNRAEALSGEVPFNPTFHPRAARPPFNWSVSSGSGGLAEFRPGGGLSIVHFGREPMMLARQLILLKPGKHVIDTAFDRPPERGRLEWRVQCASGVQAPAVAIELTGESFDALPSCQAYWLELHALADEAGTQMERTVTGVQLRQLR